MLITQDDAQRFAGTFAIDFATDDGQQQASAVGSFEISNCTIKTEDTCTYGGIE